MDPSGDVTPARCAVITASDRAARGEAVDASGPAAVGALLGHGHHVVMSAIVPDDVAAITESVRNAVKADVELVLVIGGTGLGPRDVTHEALTPLLDRTLPGIAEAIRAASRDRVPTTDLSRMVFGTLDRAVIAGIPGSRGAVSDSLAILLPLLPHALLVMAGGDHERHEPVASPQGARVVHAEVTDSVLDAGALESLVADDHAGAVVSFAGVVRDHDHGRAVSTLEYEAHPTAATVLHEVARDVAATSPATAIAVAHRIGPIAIGEAALVVAVSAAHRAEAFATCARVVDVVKDRLPVWKHQVFTDGTDEWVNSA